METQAQKSFTGRTRDRRTRPIVKVMDRVARGFIAFGGISTIVAVATVCVFLVAVVVPLFRPSRVAEAGFAVLDFVHARTPARLAVDEYGVLAWIAFRDGGLVAFELETGKPLGDEVRPFGDAAPTAWSFNIEGADFCVGFDDGTVRLGAAEVQVDFISEAQAPPSVRDTPIGGRARHGDAVYVHTQPGQFRRHSFRVGLRPPLAVGADPIRQVGHTTRSDGSIVAVLSGETLTVNHVTEIRNLLTGESTSRARRTDVPYALQPEHGEPSHLLLSRLGDQLYVVWEDGYARRYDTRDTARPSFAQELRMTDAPGERLTALGFLLGRTTLLSGDSEGRVRAWFTVPDAQSPDGLRLARTRDYSSGRAAVESLATSPRSRIAAVGYRDGRVALFQVTADYRMAEGRLPGGAPALAVATGARGDRFCAVGGGECRTWSIRAGHPEITARTLFAPVWYEGYAEPRHMWQSSAGVDSFEPKYGIVPLIFGTLKATFYSMLFGLPVALLAAIFTSEFMHPRVKMRVKPVIETMASLPSVVLGFLSALVIAPWAEFRLPQVLTAFALVPATFLLGAFLWQLLPRGWALRLARWRIVFMALALPAGVAAAARLGPRVERALFAGDIMRWLDGQIGDGSGGWIVLLLPLVAVSIAALLHGLGGPFLRRRTARWTRGQVAGFDLVRFAVGVLLTLGVVALLARGLTALGLDPRGASPRHFLGTYVQRNALVVGFVMGFAVIPIIYTISEDALSAVPEHLRSASLGAGATPWQTAIRIVIPTATSGLFSAAMIGLGRAVGETMIVLMAAGNTPLLQMNLFNGFRTLAANIAVELSEAPVGGTHYRTLFLTALVLFALTFVLNTAAERVRVRFRKRAFKL